MPPTFWIVNVALGITGKSAQQGEASHRRGGVCGTALLSVPAIAQSDPVGCASTFNLFIPGTWETNENADPNQSVGMLAPVAEAIAAKNGARARTYTLVHGPHNGAERYRRRGRRVRNAGNDVASESAANIGTLV